MHTPLVDIWNDAIVQNFTTLSKGKAAEREQQHQLVLHTLEELVGANTLTGVYLLMEDPSFDNNEDEDGVHGAENCDKGPMGHGKPVLLLSGQRHWSTSQNGNRISDVKEAL